jgi:hypothetical protein
VESDLRARIHEHKVVAGVVRVDAFEVPLRTHDIVAEPIDAQGQADVARDVVDLEGVVAVTKHRGQAPHEGPAIATPDPPWLNCPAIVKNWLTKPGTP